MRTAMDFYLTTEWLLIFIISIRSGVSVKKLFKGNDLDEITKAYGEKFDMLNLQFILRSKRYYKMEPAAIYAQLIPVNYKLKKEEITAMVEATSSEEGEQIFNRTWYGRKYQQMNLISMEELYNNMLRTVLEKRGSQRSLFRSCFVFLSLSQRT